MQGVVPFFSPYLLLVISWDVEWIFFGGFSWFVVGFLLFTSKPSRRSVKGDPVEIVVGERLAGLKGISGSLAAPVIFYEFVNT
jgi:hypothetical protein